MVGRSLLATAFAAYKAERIYHQSAIMSLRQMIDTLLFQMLYLRARHI
jgi:hypothetical protein